jgi:hypothetical protein
MTTATHALLGLAAAQQRAEAAGLALGAYVAQAVRAYADQAVDEEWITLLGLMGRAQDPGSVCLNARWAMRWGRPIEHGSAAALRRSRRHRNAATCTHPWIGLISRSLVAAQLL